jgi:hypothetical protein
VEKRFDGFKLTACPDSSGQAVMLYRQALFSVSLKKETEHPGIPCSL